jgi:hypothetical protein
MRSVSKLNEFTTTPSTDALVRVQRGLKGVHARDTGSHWKAVA